MISFRNNYFNTAYTCKIAHAKLNKSNANFTNFKAKNVLYKENANNNTLFYLDKAKDILENSTKGYLSDYRSRPYFEFSQSGKTDSNSYVLIIRPFRNKEDFVISFDKNKLSSKYNPEFFDGTLNEIASTGLKLLCESNQKPIKYSGLDTNFANILQKNELAIKSMHSETQMLNKQIKDKIIKLEKFEQEDLSDRKNKALEIANMAYFLKLY